MFDVTCTICIFTSQIYLLCSVLFHPKILNFSVYYKNKMNRNYPLVQIFYFSGLKIEKKISINPLTAHGEDSTQVVFSEREELCQFDGCCTAFVFVCGLDGLSIDRPNLTRKRRRNSSHGTERVPRAQKKPLVLNPHHVQLEE